MLTTVSRIRDSAPTRFELVVPDEHLAVEARRLGAGSGSPDLTVQVGGVSDVLRRATLAIACTGTVTLECALFGVPTVALYRTSSLTYHIAKRLVSVKYLAMPNLLADAPVFPEFIQGAATAENLSSAALALLTDETRRQAVKARLGEVVLSLGGPGASRRAAAAIERLLPN
jgi:lipid-A-disaccharide synthase